MTQAGDGLLAGGNRERAQRESPAGAARPGLFDVWSTRAWGLGARARQILQRAGLLGPCDGLLRHLGPLVIPPPRRALEARLPLDLHMRVPPGFPSGRTYAAGLYEPAVTKAILELVRPGMTVVDVGANVGYYTLLASRLVGPGGRVYSFEPVLSIFEVLLSNLRDNDCDNVTAERKAISDRSGDGRFLVDRYGTEGRLVAKGGHIVVECTTLDEYFGALGWPAVDVVKMDIEGGEPAALSGMRELVQRSPRLRIILELNWPALRAAGWEHRELALLLYNLGFRKGRVLEREGETFELPWELPRSQATSNLLLNKADRG